MKSNKLDQDHAKLTQNAVRQFTSQTIKDPDDNSTMGMMKRVMTAADYIVSAKAYQTSLHKTIKVRRKTQN